MLQYVVLYNETEVIILNKKIGFIGCGNMATAMISSIVESKLVAKDNLHVSDAYAEPKESIKDAINFYRDNDKVVKEADYIFLAVKPYLYDEVISKLDKNVLQGKIIVSIAAGINIKFLEDRLGTDAKIIRTMPNTPAMVGAGFTAVCPNKNITESELNTLKEIASTFGAVEEIKEELFEAVIAIASSSPAYMFMIIEAMADAGVHMGLPRNSAYKMAANAMLGSAKLQIETGKHPGELKDMVTSPKGTTIEAVRRLEEKGLRSAIIEGMMSCYHKAKNM